METIEKYARKCDVTGKGINEGYCIMNGEIYISGHFAMVQHITDETDYKDIDEAYEDDYYYFTEWELKNNENYFDEQGNEYNCNGILINDLFEHYDELPQEVKDILDEFNENGNTYSNCEILVEKLNAVGYTCEYYLDAEPFNLKKL